MKGTRHMSMNISQWIKKAERFDLQAYKPPRDPGRLQNTHVAYCGALFKHPYDEKLALLVTDPGSGNTAWLEFRIEDIAYVETLPSVASPDGDVVSMVRIWVRKMSVGVRHTPFLVEDLSIRGGR
jgi:hypothetical protein